MRERRSGRAADPGAADREALAREFGGAARDYRENALLQKEAAGRLVELLEPRVGSLPSGPVLEVGCGTGFVSERLCRLFPGRTLHLTDLSTEMVCACTASLAHHRSDRLRFFTADAERWEGEERYALVVAGFVAQWFRDPAAGLRRLAELLLPGGLLLVSLPTEGSFPEWRRAGEDAGEAFRGEPLPHGPSLAASLSSPSLDVTWTEEWFEETHDNPLEFFLHLRRIGAANRSARSPLSPGAIRRLIRAWERRAGTPTRVSYRVLFLGARRAAVPARRFGAPMRERLP